MIYNQLNLSNTNDFSAQSSLNQPKIEVWYNNKPIHQITGPVPVVDISYSFNNNGNNLADSLNTNISLNGKILRWPEGPPISNVDTDKAHPGFSGIIAGVSGLKNLFSETPYGVLAFKCQNNILYQISGLRVIDISFSNTEDNWAQSADYSIKLEGGERLWKGSGEGIIEQFVKDRQDSWNIEPLDDTGYTQFTQPVNSRYEYSNPKLNRLNTNTNTNTTTETNTLQVINIPQFRITRKLSAKGSVRPLATSGTITQQELPDENTKPYVFAKAWVEYMSKKTFASSQSSLNDSRPYINHPFFMNNGNLFAFNHNRTINIDIFNGTYEANDTWLAMPTGIPFTETYTLEASTSEDYVKSVRVVGNIIGLSIPNHNLMIGATGTLPTGTGNGGVIDGKLSLTSYMSPNQKISGSYDSLDINNANNIGSSNTTLNPILPATEKYQNALSGWLNHIKPLLYRRANLVVNSADRTLNYMVPNTIPPQLPNNPIYSKESLLSTIPVNTSEGHDPRKGTISYSYEFNNKLNLISGVISENINVSYNNPIDSTTEIPVVGRALGPILQRTGRSLPKKSISIEIAIPPATGISQLSLNHTSCPLHRTGYLFKTIEQIIEAHRPYTPSTFITNEPIQTEGLVYTSDDNEQWNPSTGKYSRSLTWVYQQASITTDFRDH